MKEYILPRLLSNDVRKMKTLNPHYFHNRRNIYLSSFSKRLVSRLGNRRQNSRDTQSLITNYGPEVTGMDTSL